MAEPSVQLPTREQIAALIEELDDAAMKIALDDEPVDDEVGLLREAARVLALFPQPTPSAEPVNIADMAPFTNFTADTWPGAFPVRWRKEPDGWFSRIVTGGRSYFPEPEFDQSTIRDVTPPPATPEVDR